MKHGAKNRPFRPFFEKTELKRMREVGPGIYTIWPDSGRTLAVMAITGRNQNASGWDPACLLGLPVDLVLIIKINTNKK